ncbi:MAG: M64 family metallopeptidase [Candidatus Micrarchaeia archaeon]|jgi:hypothetical protein
MKPQLFLAFLLSAFFLFGCMETLPLGSESQTIEPPQPECLANSDCNSTEHCVAGSCAGVTGLCGYAENHSWYEYQCCADGACSSNEECVEHSCANESYENLTWVSFDGYEHCIGAETNDLDSNKINVIFIGVGYDNLTSVKEIANGLVDYAGDGNGLFSFVPFDSNRDKFNIWISDQIFYENEHESFLKQQRYDFDVDGVYSLAGTNCPLPNAFITAVVRYPSCTYVTSADGHAWMNAGDDYNEDINFYEDWSNRTHTNDTISILALRLAPVFVHEFGHAFAGLDDEYIEMEYRGMDYIPRFDIYADNCFVATSLEECRRNAPWKNFIGQGSGISKVDCYEGCNHFGRGVYRPTLHSIMYGAEGMYVASGSYHEQPDYFYYNHSIVFGPYLEYLLQKRIDELTS